MTHLGCLTFTVPEDLVLESNQRREVNGLIPGTRVVEFSATWKSPTTELFAFLWDPYPPRPGGPMATEETWLASCCGQTVTVSRTSMFFGTAQEVLVTHLSLTDPNRAALIYARGMERDAFMDILAQIERSSI